MILLGGNCYILQEFYTFGHGHRNLKKFHAGFTPNACILDIKVSMLSSALTLIDLILSTIEGTSKSLSYPLDIDCFLASKELDKP